MPVLKENDLSFSSDNLDPVNNANQSMSRQVSNDIIEKERLQECFSGPVNICSSGCFTGIEQRISSNGVGKNKRPKFKITNDEYKTPEMEFEEIGESSQVIIQITDENKAEYKFPELETKREEKVVFSIPGVHLNEKVERSENYETLLNKLDKRNVGIVALDIEHDGKLRFDISDVQLSKNIPEEGDKMIPLNDILLKFSRVKESSNILLGIAKMDENNIFDIYNIYPLYELIEIMQKEKIDPENREKLKNIDTELTKRIEIINGLSNFEVQIFDREKLKMTILLLRIFQKLKGFTIVVHNGLFDLFVLYKFLFLSHRDQVPDAKHFIDVFGEINIQDTKLINFYQDQDRKDWNLKEIFCYKMLTAPCETYVITNIKTSQLGNPEPILVKQILKPHNASYDAAMTSILFCIFSKVLDTKNYTNHLYLWKYDVNIRSGEVSELEKKKKAVEESGKNDDQDLSDLLGCDDQFDGN